VAVMIDEHEVRRGQTLTLLRYTRIARVPRV
jgi:hypothetical protein